MDAMTENFDILNAAVSPLIKAALPAARFSGRVRKRSLKRLAAMDADAKDNHVWSIDTTELLCWGLWPIHVFVVIDHFSRKVMSVTPLEGPNAGWINNVLESAIEKHGAPKHIMSDQAGPLGQQVHRPNAAVGEAPGSFGQVIMEVRHREHGGVLFVPRNGLKSSLHSLLASSQSSG